MFIYLYLFSSQYKLCEFVLYIKREGKNARHARHDGNNNNNAKRQPPLPSLLNSGQVNKSNDEAAVAVEKELEKRELDEVFPGKKASRTVTRRDDWKNKQNARKRNKIRCLAKVESLDWGSNEGREGGREARGDT